MTALIAGILLGAAGILVIAWTVMYLAVEGVRQVRLCRPRPPACPPCPHSECATARAIAELRTATTTQLWSDLERHR